MTINKSQGQSIDKLAVCFPKPCFVHGQLYVAYSRSGHPPTGRNGVRVAVVDSSKQGVIQGQYILFYNIDSTADDVVVDLRVVHSQVMVVCTHGIVCFLT